jgi:hypothetical protein
MIDLHTPLSFRTSYAFPLQNRLARREVLLGAALLLIPVVGWLLNMGHRIMMVHRMQQGLPAWPSWRDYPQLLKHGLITFVGMLYYYTPGLVLAYIAWSAGSLALGIVAAVLLALATVAIPGYMTHYCRTFDPAEIYNPVRALGRTFQGGRAYWKAWCITISALLLSFSGLLAFGIGFLVTSVWFWQVAGFSFSRVFTQRVLNLTPPLPEAVEVRAWLPS